jgi:hypothetical protein
MITNMTRTLRQTLTRAHGCAPWALMRLSCSALSPRPRLRPGSSESGARAPFSLASLQQPDHRLLLRPMLGSSPRHGPASPPSFTMTFIAVRYGPCLNNLDLAPFGPVAAFLSSANPEPPPPTLSISSPTLAVGPVHSLPAPSPLSARRLNYSTRDPTRSLLPSPVHGSHANSAMGTALCVSRSLWWMARSSYKGRLCSAMSVVFDGLIAGQGDRRSGSPART